jgi:prepilin-type N-terminal cleavage/methylation domain-containing protein
MSDAREVHPAGSSAGVHRTRTTPAQAGFTLIEVLMAMVILSVGLLSLMPLGATGLTMVALADQRTERTMEAASHMDRSMLQLRSTGALADSSWTLPSGDKIVRTASRAADTKVWAVSVQVAPGTAVNGARALTLTNHVFLP